MSLENFGIKVSEIFRVQIRANKIHVCLWSIILMLYISETVRKFATSFMFSFLLRFEWDTELLAGREIEDEVGLRNMFTICIYCLIYINVCIATTVVEARSCNQRDLGSSPSGTLLDFFIFFDILTFLFWQGWAWVSLAFCTFLFSLHPLAHLINMCHFYIFPFYSDFIFFAQT